MKGRFTPRYTSNAGIFANRGDPWVSSREGERDYGRNVESEDPERDQALARTRMEERGLGESLRAQAERLFGRNSPEASKARSIEDLERRKADAAGVARERKAAMVVNKMNQAILKANKGMIRVPEALSRPVKPVLKKKDKSDG